MHVYVCRCLREIESVANIKHVLSSTTHNGFPVLRSEPDEDDQLPLPRPGQLDSTKGGPLQGLILRSQLVVLLDSKARLTWLSDHPSSDTLAWLSSHCLFPSCLCHALHNCLGAKLWRPGLVCHCPRLAWEARSSTKLDESRVVANDASGAGLL